MAQDSGAPNNSAAQKQDVDIDNIEVEILIVAKNPALLKSTASFLSRRGWPTTVIGNVSKAIEEIAQKRPDFVMISLNHSNPAVLKLPDLISQTFNLECIGFVENNDSSSNQKLNQIKMLHKIFGQPSGPSFQRSIRKILSDKFDVKSEERAAGEAANEESGNLTIRGSVAEEGADVMKSGSLASHRAAAAETSEKDAHGNSVVIQHNEQTQFNTQETAASSGPAHGKQKLSTLKRDRDSANGEDAGSAPGATDASADGPSASGSGVDGRAHAPTSSGATYDAAAPKLAASISPDHAPALSVGDSAMPGAVAGAAAEDKAADTDGGVITNGKYTMGSKPRKSLKQLTGQTTPAAAAGKANGDDPAALPSDESTPAVEDLIGQLKKSLFGEKGAEDQAHQSALEKAVEKAMHLVCHKKTNLDPIPLRTVTKVGVFPVESNAFPGYLVLALQAPPEDLDFLETCEQSLQNTFTDSGIPGNLQKGFWLELPEVQFEAWATTQAEFTIKLDYQGAELGVAFFKSEKPLPQARLSAETGMATIAIDDIATDQPVNFKAYLHLAKNKRYFLYLRNGRHLQPEQKERLKGHSVNDIFMKSVDVENLRRFLAGVYLRGSIKSAG